MGVNILLEMNSVSSLTLPFASLGANNAGTYTCRVEAGTFVKIKDTELLVISMFIRP